MWLRSAASVSACEEEHHEPGVATEACHVHRAPPISRGELGVSSILDQEFSNLRTLVSSLLCHGLQWSQTILIVLVDVNTADVLSQELF